MSGLFAGQTLTIWTLVGSLIYPNTASQKPTFIDQCPFEKINFYSNRTFPASIPVDTEHAGLLGLYHIAFLLVPISGFAISLTVGAIVSLLTGEVHTKLIYMIACLTEIISSAQVALVT